MVATPVELDEAGEAMWRALGERWDDGPAHDRFVQHCFATGRLAAAAARYRARLDRAPDDATARRMRDRVIFLATQALVPSPRPAAGRAWTSWLPIVIVVAAALGAVLGLFVGGRR